MYCNKVGEGRAGRMHLQLLETSVGTTGGKKKERKEERGRCVGLPYKI